MKKIGLIVFISAITIGSIVSANYSFGNIETNQRGTEGSGVLKTETRDLAEFDEILADNAVDIEISVGGDFNVTVKTDDNLLQHIRTETSGDTLKIYSEGGISSQSKITINISMPELKALSVSGASTANVSNVKTDSIRLEASGASKIKIDGAAAHLELEASGASGIDAAALKVENAQVEASGASRATVWAENGLEATASGASSVYHIGEPKNIEVNTSGVSSVKKQ